MIQQFSAEFIFGMIAACVALIAWAVRVESRVLAHDREIERLRTEQQNQSTQMLEELRAIRDRLDRIVERKAFDV